MDRCLIHPAVKFTCHSYSRPLHNSSTCYSTGAHNISFIKTPCPPPPLLSCVQPHFTWNLFCVCEQPGKRGVHGLSTDSGPRGPPPRDNDDSPPAPPHLPASFLPSILTLSNEARFDLAATCKCAPRWRMEKRLQQTQPHLHSHKHTHKQRVHLQRDSVSRSLISRWEFPIITRSSSQHNPETALPFSASPPPPSPPPPPRPPHLQHDKCLQQLHRGTVRPLQSSVV